MVWQNCWCSSFIFSSHNWRYFSHLTPWLCGGGGCLQKHFLFSLIFLQLNFCLFKTSKSSSLWLLVTSNRRIPVKSGRGWTHWTAAWSSSNPLSNAWSNASKSCRWSLGKSRKCMKIYSKKHCGSCTIVVVVLSLLKIIFVDIWSICRRCRHVINSLISMVDLVGVLLVC